MGFSKRKTHHGFHSAFCVSDDYLFAVSLSVDHGPVFLAITRAGRESTIHRNYRMILLHRSASCHPAQELRMLLPHTGAVDPGLILELRHHVLGCAHGAAPHQFRVLLNLAGTALEARMIGRSVYVCLKGDCCEDGSDDVELIVVFHITELLFILVVARPHSLHRA